MKKVVFALVMVTMTATVASGAIIFQDNFDGYADQAAFNAAWNVSLVGGGGILSTEQAFSPSQSIKQDLTAKQSGTSIAACWGTDAQPLEWSFEFYDSTQAANLRQFASFRDLSGGLAQLVAIGAYNDTTLTKNRYTGSSASMADLNTYYACRVLYQGGPGWFILNGPGAPTRSTGWHELKAVFKDTTVEFYVDGVNALSGLTTQYANSVGSVSFDTVLVGSGLSSPNGVGYYDNVLVNQVPEPAVAVLLGLGGLLFGRRRRIA